MKKSSIISALLLFLAALMLSSCIIPYPYWGDDGYYDGGHREGGHHGGGHREGGGRD